MDELPPHPAPEARPELPPFVRLMKAATLQAQRARALEQIALAALPGAVALRPPITHATAGVPQQGELPPAAVTAPAHAAWTSGAPTRRPREPIATEATQPQTAAAETGGTSRYDHGATAAAPFGPHPSPLRLPPAEPHTQPPAPPPQYPESELLAEERLRERLARILRADGLRHGLDLKER